MYLVVNEMAGLNGVLGPSDFHCIEVDDTLRYVMAIGGQRMGCRFDTQIWGLCQLVFA